MPSPRRRTLPTALIAFGLTAALAGGIGLAGPAGAAPVDDSVVKACGSSGCGGGAYDVVLTPVEVTAGESITVRFSCDGTEEGALARALHPSGLLAGWAELAVEEVDPTGLSASAMPEQQYEATGTIPAGWPEGTSQVEAGCLHGAYVWSDPLPLLVHAAPATTVPPTTTTWVLPPAPPASHGALDVTAAELRPEGATELVATGYQPGTEVRFAVYSEPVLLGSSAAGADGVARLAVDLPAGLPLGAHTVASFGLAPDGSERVLVRSITVGEPAPAVAPASLPRTGGTTGQLALAGVALVAAGSLVLVGRRRGLLGH